MDGATGLPRSHASAKALTVRSRHCRSFAQMKVCEWRRTTWRLSSQPSWTCSAVAVPLRVSLMMCPTTFIPVQRFPYKTLHQARAIHEGCDSLGKQMTEIAH